MTIKLRAFPLVLLCLVPGLLAGCQCGTNVTPVQIIDIGDGGLISQEPCGAPCFMGVIPGESTPDDVRERFEEYNLVSACEENTGWYCSGIPSHPRVYFDKYYSKVSIITFHTFNTILGSITDTYGEPDRWIYEQPSGDSGNELPYYYLELCFDKINTIARLESIDTNLKYMVQKSSVVTDIVYFEGECTNYYEFSNAWLGFGEYSKDTP